uniref:Uncharacterized protein n=1 Tax=Macaca fascicularis TaxID=9541 RepID=Q8HXI5_MACFA|nr:hypothetical protein [Macaca fascicularis]
MSLLHTGGFEHDHQNSKNTRNERSFLKLFRSIHDIPLTVLENKMCLCSFTEVPMNLFLNVILLKLYSSLLSLILGKSCLASLDLCKNKCLS